MGLCKPYFRLNPLVCMKTFCEYLKSVEAPEELCSILETLKDAAKRIADHIVTADRGKAGSMNIFGEEQLELDVLSDKIIQEECGGNQYIGLLASEELPEEIKISDGEYGICYDPLDGSSLVDVNLAVGSIFGVYKTKSFIGVKGTEMLAAMAAVYGPRSIPGSRLHTDVYPHRQSGVRCKLLS